MDDRELLERLGTCPNCGLSWDARRYNGVVLEHDTKTCGISKRAIDRILGLPAPIHDPEALEAWLRS